MNVLVTGATGFIGRHLTAALYRQGHRVVCLARNKGRARILNPFCEDIVYSDLIDFETVREKLGGRGDIEVLFHCAGYVNNKNPDLLYKGNVTAAETGCRLALSLGIKRVVYLSSVAVVSGHSQSPLVEDLPYKATNQYGRSKIQAEERVLSYRKEGLEIVILRPCMVYGEDEPHLMRTLLVLLKYRLLPLINHGRNKLHLVYVGNVVAAMIEAMRGDQWIKGSFFIADKEVLSLYEVCCLMARGINAAEPYGIPRFLTFWLKERGFLGKKLGFFLKDRSYNLDKIFAAGFSPPYSVYSSLPKSARINFYKDMEFSQLYPDMKNRDF